MTDEQADPIASSVWLAELVGAYYTALTNMNVPEETAGSLTFGYQMHWLGLINQTRPDQDPLPD